MLTWLSNFLNSNGFAPHGVCLLWRPELLWTHVISDVVIALAYFSIPISLGMLAYKRSDLEFRGTFWLFAAFIFLCGMTHLVGMITIWQPIYGVQAVIKTATAVVSVATAAYMFPLLPRLMRIPSPAAMQQANDALREAVSQRNAAFLEVQQKHEELAKLNRQLDARAKEAENRSLELEFSNENLTLFNRLVSHDLKAPLRAMDQLAQWVDEDNPTLNTESKDHLAKIRSRAQRMKTLLDDMLAFTSADRESPAPERVDSRSLVEEIFDEADKDSETRLVVEDPMPVLNTSPAKLAQVFQNLIGNAIKHHDLAKKNITISAVDAGDSVVFRITDDGPGVPPRHHERIFDIFEQLKPRDQVEGSGLGLAIVKRLVASQGGTLQVTSEEGRRGTTFEFGWPKSDN